MTESRSQREILAIYVTFDTLSISGLKNVEKVVQQDQNFEIHETMTYFGLIDSILNIKKLSQKVKLRA